MPRSAHNAASRRVSLRSLVLMSIHVLPGRIPDRIPFSPLTTALTATGEGRQVNTTDDTAAVDAGESAQVAPPASKLSAKALFRSWTVTS